MFSKFMIMPRNMIVLVATIIGALLLSAGVWMFHFFASESSDTEIPETVKLPNDHFQEGERLYFSGDLTGAEREYREALKEEALTLGREAQVFYRLASVAAVDDPEGALQDFKDIVINTLYPSRIRASAVYGLYATYQRSPRESVKKVLFSEPYDMYYQDGSINSGLISLLKFSRELRPIDVTEMTLALEYAHALELSLANPEDRSADAIKAEHLPLIKEKIEAGNKISDDPEGRNRTNAPFYSMRARVVALTERLTGEVIGDYKADHEAALSVLREESLADDSFTRWYYAADLALSREASADAKILELIGPLTDKNTANEYYKRLHRFFADVRTADLGTSDDRDALILIAKLDQDMKSLLLSLGWSEADFR